MKTESPPQYEVVEIAKHEKGSAQIITFLGPEKETVELLYEPSTSFSMDPKWFTWPTLLRVRDAYEFWFALHYYKRVQHYNPPAMANYELKPRAAASRCMFCHTDMSGLSASCLSCGGAMHLDCAFENGNSCATPGCSERKPSQKDRISG